MEEILASIRRIIADDQEVLRSASAERGDTSHVKNVLELTERQTAQMLDQPRDESDDDAREPESLQRVDLGDRADLYGHSDNDLQLVSYHDDEDEIEEVPTRERAEPASAFSDPRRTDTLLSSAADASVADAFTRLGSTIMPTQPVTLEDLMKDMLRPMLKSWLDENLPSLVERLVQAEIERISRGRR